MELGDGDFFGDEFSGDISQYGCMDYRGGIIHPGNSVNVRETQYFCRRGEGPDSRIYVFGKTSFLDSSDCLCV